MSSLVGPDLPNSRRVGLVTQIVARSASEIRRLRSAPTRRRQLDLAQALEHGVAQRIVGGAVGVVDVRRQHRPHRDDVLRRAVERSRARSRSGSSRASRSRERRRVEAGADLAAIVQLAIDPLAERQRAEPLGRLRRGVAGDDEVADLAAPWSWSRSSSARADRAPIARFETMPSSPSSDAWS